MPSQVKLTQPNVSAATKLSNVKLTQPDVSAPTKLSTVMYLQLCKDGTCEDMRHANSSQLNLSCEAARNAGTRRLSTRADLCHPKPSQFKLS